MNLNPECFDVICPVRTACEVGEIKLYLIPAVVQAHWHCANERLNAGCRLVITCAESPPDIFIVQYLYFEGEIFLQVFNDHHKKRQFDGQGLFGIRRTCDMTCGDVGADEFEYGRLNIGIGHALEMTVAHLLIPYL